MSPRSWALIDFDISIERVTNAAYSSNESRVALISLDLSPQLHDKRVKTSVCDLLGMDPARRKKLIASERGFRCIEKSNEEIEFCSGEVNLDPWSPHQTPEPHGKLEVVEIIAAPVRDSLWQAIVSHRCFQPGNAFTGSERLRKVVGRTRFQPKNFMVLVNEVRADDYYWRMRQRGQALYQRKRCFRMDFQDDGVCELRSNQSQEFCFPLRPTSP